MIDILLPGIQPVRAKLKSNAKNGRCNVTPLVDKQK